MSDKTHHIVPYRTYGLILVLLLVLTGISVAVTQIELSRWSTPGGPAAGHHQSRPWYWLFLCTSSLIRSMYKFMAIFDRAGDRSGHSALLSLITDSDKIFAICILQIHNKLLILSPASTWPSWSYLGSFHIFPGRSHHCDAGVSLSANTGRTKHPEGHSERRAVTNWNCPVDRNPPGAGPGDVLFRMDGLETHEKSSGRGPCA
jgi:hypothetical protein